MSHLAISHSQLQRKNPKPIPVSILMNTVRRHNDDTGNILLTDTGLNLITDTGENLLTNS